MTEVHFCREIQFFGDHRGFFVISVFQTALWGQEIRLQRTKHIKTRKVSMKKQIIRNKVGKGVGQSSGKEDCNV